MNKEAIQDQHLDLLIRLAFEQINEEEINDLIQSDDPPLSAEESKRMEQCYQRAICIGSGWITGAASVFATSFSQPQ